MELRGVYRAAFVAACIFMLFACTNSSHKNASQNSPKPEPGTIRVITYRADSEVSYKNKVPYLRTMAKNLGLPILIGGYPGLYMRVWAWDSTNTKWVIDLRKSSTGNACLILSYTEGVKDTAFYIYVHEEKQVVPRSGWPEFFSTLGKFHIPKMEKEKVARDHKDEFTSLAYVQFEVDEPNQYLYVEYPDPSYFRKEDTACALIYGFFEYFNKEMGTNIYEIGKTTNSQ